MHLADVTACRSAGILALVLIALCAPAFATEDKGGEQDKVDTENLFGFTEGTDTGKRGEQEVILDTIGRFSKRRAGPGASNYTTFQPLLSYQYDPTDNFSIEPGLFFDTHDARNVAGVPDKSFGTFNGGSLELKYQFQKRTNDNPFGVAIQAEPFYERVQPIEGQGADIFSMDTRLIADARLIPDKLWAGVNLIYDPSVARLRGSGEVDRTSTLSVSGTLIMKITDKLFFGPEARYMRAYDGAFLNRFEGHAVFLGPVLNYQVEEKGFLTLAYSTQVFGHDRDPDFTDHAFDLNHFARHNLRVRFGVSF